MNIPLERLTAESFAPFGVVIAFPSYSQEPFEVIVREPQSPWRIGLYRYSNHEIETMELHTTSMESFEPLSGASVLLVAEKDTPAAPRAFFLEHPICLHKNVWHQTLALTENASVKITENLEVTKEIYKLGKPVYVMLSD